MAAAATMVDKIVAELLDEGRADGGMDLVGQFADRIPVYLINHLLDVPAEDWGPFVAWSRAIALTSEAQLSTKVLHAGNEALEAMREYFGALVAARRAAPGDDMLSMLATEEVGGERMGTEELLDGLIFLYQAGHPTSTQLIVLAMYSLLRHPDQLARLRADRSLLPMAVEELQRYDGPVQMNDRVALTDLRLFGVDVSQGQLVRLCLGSANRDDERYADADRLDLGRVVTDQLGYGRGLHHCVGATLGQVQARIAIGALLDRAPGMRLTGERIRFLPSAGNRGLVALPVEF
jgi:cytochrome P450